MTFLVNIDEENERQTVNMDILHELLAFIDATRGHKKGELTARLVDKLGQVFESRRIQSKCPKCNDRVFQEIIYGLDNKNIKTLKGKIFATDIEGLKLIMRVGANPYLIACNYTKRHLKEDRYSMEEDCHGLYSILEGSVVLTLQSMTKPRNAGLFLRNFEADTILCQTDEEEGAVYRMAGNSEKWAFSKILRNYSEQQMGDMKKLSGRTEFSTVKYRSVHQSWYR